MSAPSTSTATADGGSAAKKIVQDLSEASSTPASLRPLYSRLVSQYDRKLWYQLTQTLQELVQHHDARSTPKDLIQLYHGFVNTFASKISQNSLVNIAVVTARGYSDPSEALQFLLTVSEQVDDPSSQEAFVTARMEAAHFQLLLGQLENTSQAMEKCGKILDTFDAVEMATHAAFYRVSGDYHKAKASYASYYRNSLLYLACINVDRDLSLEDRAQRAHDLGVSALLGETIYNFGELLLHPILSSLSSTPYAYLSDLLFAFNAGDIGKFEALSPKLSSGSNGSIPILAENSSFLRQKICLMALIESVFKRASDDRTLRFETIASETKLPVGEVEHLVMKALSLKLIRGTLDQHSQLARITWVQPRVLDKRQIQALQSRLDDWCKRVQETAEFVKGQAAADLFVTV